jgi:hemerythrin-like domain-containing protein
MPIQIGEKPGHNFAQPIGLLTDCHRRIEMFLGVLVKLAEELHGQEMSLEQRRAFNGALTYFREAAPKHTADEELSLFPRFRAAGGPEVEHVLADLDRLEADHVYANCLHLEVEALGLEWLRDGRLPQESAARLRSITSELRAIYKAHIEVEDHRVFPLAARVLGADAQREIGHEMATRRNLAW